MSFSRVFLFVVLYALSNAEPANYGLILHLISVFPPFYMPFVFQRISRSATTKSLQQSRFARFSRFAKRKIFSEFSFQFAVSAISSLLQSKAGGDAHDEKPTFTLREVISHKEMVINPSRRSNVSIE